MSDIIIQSVDCETGEEIRRSLTAEEAIDFETQKNRTTLVVTKLENEEANSRAIREQLRVGLDQFDVHLTNLNSAAPTAAQQKAALIFSLRASKHLVRLALRVLDNAN